ncbi:MAG: 23S rRNA (adenine(2503)-C(2))-methyltransferase RlmN [Rickettsiales bacterium]|jgi:23S rRNA (adenine2503-C2)-methyltransferase|nr:23S rRNA (adenine(2503)-C(2))-methyltransferase RlmN [Rickettsiales bacterium]
MNKEVLFGKTLAEIEALAAGLGEPKFRARQIMDWLDKGVASFAEMKNLPAGLRAKLGDAAAVLPCEIVKVLESKDGGTKKLLLGFSTPHQNRGAVLTPPQGGSCLIETVLMRTRYGNSVCVSSQAGCAMGCAFCASTLRGFSRNLTANEMMAQVAAAQSLLVNERVSHVVIMGSGEPLLNLDNVLEFIEKLNTPHQNRGAVLTPPQGGSCRGGISYRKITLSTCGVVPGIDRLTEWGKPINLALSLHAPDDELRSRIMPINAKYPIAEVMAATDRWQAATKRQLTAEYIVLGGVNDSAGHAEGLADLIGSRDVFVNLIPFNPVAEREFIAPSGNAVHRMKDALEARKIPCAIRFERGADIQSACGQLRNGQKI